MASVVTPEVIQQQLLPILTQLVTDPIPNIRFNVAKSLEVVITVLKKHQMQNIINDTVRPLLQKLEEDADAEVKFYSKRAISVGMNEHFSLPFFLRCLFSGTR